MLRREGFAHSQKEQCGKEQGHRFDRACLEVNIFLRT